MNKELQSKIVDFHGRKYITSENFSAIIGKNPQVRPKDYLRAEGRKYVSLEYFEYNYYKIPLTDRKLTQVMEYYTDTFGECKEFVWVDFIKAAKLFILMHCHWEDFKSYQEFIPYRIPKKITYAHLAEFYIPDVLAFQLARQNRRKDRNTFNYNCTKGFDRAVEDTIGF